jgi:hypothetical protein
MIVITSGERVSNAVLWVFTATLTLYLFYGIYNTIEVIATM